jgi:hypothetical protein
MINLLSISTVTAISRPVDIFYCDSNLIITYDEKAANDPFLPIDRIKEINVSITYFIEGYYAEQVAPVYPPNFIFLKVFSKPNWCTITLSPDFLKLHNTAEGVTTNITMIIQVSENAPALDNDIIGIEAKVDSLGAILGDIFKTNISFIPGYLPILNVNIVDNTYDLIGPLDTSSFDIEIENLGNAKTIATAQPINVPKGWIVSVIRDTLIEASSSTTGSLNKKVITLTVEPPREFGYHNDRKEIQISITPSYFEDSTLKGQDYYLSVIVQSKGFSTPGYEFTLLFLGIVIFILFSKKFSKQNNINSKTSGED